MNPPCSISAKKNRNTFTCVAATFGYLAWCLLVIYGVLCTHRTCVCMKEVEVVIVREPMEQEMKSEVTQIDLKISLIMIIGERDRVDEWRKELMCKES